MYADFRDKNAVFSGMFSRYLTDMSVSFSGRTERVQGEMVSGTYFPKLGVGAALGRVFARIGRHSGRGRPVRGPELQLLGLALRGGSKRDRRKTDRQRVSPDHRGRQPPVSTAWIRVSPQIRVPIVMKPQLIRVERLCLRPDQPTGAMGERVRPPEAGHDCCTGQSGIAAAVPSDAGNGGARGGVR